MRRRALLRKPVRKRQREVNFLSLRGLYRIQNWKIKHAVTSMGLVCTFLTSNRRVSACVNFTFDGVLMACRL